MKRVKPFVHPRLGVAELRESWDPNRVPEPAPPPQDFGEQIVVENAMGRRIVEEGLARRAAGGHRGTRMRAEEWAGWMALVLAATFTVAVFTVGVVVGLLV
jgi:hypothetical protein